MAGEREIKVTYCQPGYAYGYPMPLTAYFSSTSHKGIRWDEVAAWNKFRDRGLIRLAAAKLLAELQILGGVPVDIQGSSPKLRRQQQAYRFFFEDKDALIWWRNLGEFEVKKVLNAAEKIFSGELKFKKISAPGSSPHYARQRLNREKRGEREIEKAKRAKLKAQREWRAML